MTDPSCTLIIFGASGDLTYRKLIPAIYSLAQTGGLNAETRVIGVARSAMEPTEYRKKLSDAIAKHVGDTSVKKADPKAIAAFVPRVNYVRMSSYDCVDDFKRLADLVFRTEPYKNLEKVLVYLALPPEAFNDTITSLGAAGLNASNCTLVVEKPLGHDAESATEVEKLLHSQFAENQIARIDHYLGKTQALNLMGFRFANTFVEPIWNDHYIERIIITASESVDVGGRIGYYEQNGVVVDMVQSHLLQLLALATMEAPQDLKADFIRDEKMKILRAIEVIRPENMLVAQYNGYKEHKGVAADSKTPTAVCLSLRINTNRWRNTNFIIQTCKCGDVRETRVDAVLRPCGFRLFSSMSMCPDPNIISFLIQPDEGITIHFETLTPTLGTPMACDGTTCTAVTSNYQTRPVQLEFNYSGSNIFTQTAYERLLQEAVQGDLSNFTRSDEVLEQWRIVSRCLLKDAAVPIVYAKNLSLLTPLNFDLWNYGRCYIRKLAYGRCRLRVGWEICASSVLASDVVTEKLLHAIQLWNQTDRSTQHFNLLMAGGNTPLPVYGTLCKKLPKVFSSDVLKHLRIWVTDEREDVGSRNNGLALKKAFEGCGVEVIELYNGTKSFEESAKEYSQKLKGVKSFQAALLGIGTDGHTCSLFPGCLPVLKGHDDQCVVQTIPQLGERRATITPLVIQRIKDVIFLAIGSEKAQALTSLAYAPFQPNLIPAQLATAQETTTVVCDHFARSTRPKFN